MKPKDLDIVQWQDLAREYWAVNPPHPSEGAFAMRCENSQLTVGWKAGGFTMDGHTFSSFCPKAVHGQCAMLAVRDDFLRFVERRLRKIETITK